VRLKSQHAAGHAALLCLALEQREHGLMTSVYAIKVANGERTGAGQSGVFAASENLHQS
jgi:hypothetical protein